MARRSDTGRVRSHNEDRVLADPSLIAVADGMGGAQAGEVAAEMAVEAIAGVARPAGVDAVRDAVRRANRDIRSAAERDPAKSGMGTTVTAALLDGGRLAVVHVGDSRAYLWRDGALRQLTEDHSVVAELVRRGSIAPEEAEAHPHRNVITRALGADVDVQVDVVSEEPRAGDVVLLCSDGLSSYVPEAAIAEALGASGDLEEVARRLVARANEAGGIDNVTVVLARVEPGEPEPGAGAGATLQVPRVSEDGPERGDTAEYARPRRDVTVIGGTQGRTGGTTATRPPAVLQEVRRRRSRVRVVLVSGFAVLVVAAGALTWVGSRTYTLAAGPGDTLWVEHGLPWEVAGLELSSGWQDTGVPVAAIREGGGEIDGGWHGRGEAVRDAAALTWRYGVADVPAIEIPAGPVLGPQPGGAAPAPTTPGP